VARGFWLSQSVNAKAKMTKKLAARETKGRTHGVGNYSSDLKGQTRKAYEHFGREKQRIHLSLVASSCSSAR